MAGLLGRRRRGGAGAVLAGEARPATAGSRRLRRAGGGEPYARRPGGGEPTAGCGCRVRGSPPAPSSAPSAHKGGRSPPQGGRSGAAVAGQSPGAGARGSPPAPRGRRPKGVEPPPAAKWGGGGWTVAGSRGAGWRRVQSWAAEGAHLGPWSRPRLLRRRRGAVVHSGASAVLGLGVGVGWGVARSVGQSGAVLKSVDGLLTNSGLKSAIMRQNCPSPENGDIL